MYVTCIFNMFFEMRKSLANAIRLLLQANAGQAKGMRRRTCSHCFTEVYCQFMFGDKNRNKLQTASPSLESHEPTTRPGQTSRENYRCEISQGESQDERGPQDFSQVPDTIFICARFLLGFHKNYKSNPDLWDPLGD